MEINPLFLKDFYKVGHIDQYPKGTELIFSNFTPRKSRMPNVNYSVLFGLKYFMQHYLTNAFSESKNDPILFGEYIQRTYDLYMQATLGIERKHTHIKDLCDLGYFPIEIYALPEKTEVPCGVPALVMYNTHPDFFWVPNMLETIMSCTLWGASTSATHANEFRKLLDKYAFETSSMPEFVDYQAHDFSFRGMFGLEAAMLSGAAHLQYFKGTDTIPAIIFNSQFYDVSPHICSVPATEHSVMSAGGKEDELQTFDYLITNIYPSGNISIVSDTWDFWKVVSEYLPALKDKIMSRKGKVIIRPDSGDPVEIICGWDASKGKRKGYYQDIGLVESLWEIFGGTINALGYKQLDNHIGCIYGDSITLSRANEICQKLKDKGFASTNVVFGIGSYTYQYNTRDTLGWAMKSTYAEVNGVGRAITKNPITDDGTKKSHSGILKVIKENGTLKVLENQTWEQFRMGDNELKLVFKNGKLI